MSGLSHIREADSSEIASFIAAMFRHADDGTTVSLRAFNDRRNDDKPKIKTVKINGHGLQPVIAAATQFATRFANAGEPMVVCPPVATFTGDRAAEADLANGLGIAVECDQRPEQARIKLESILGRATVTVRSGGVWPDPETGEICDRLHLHWRLAEPTREPAEHARLKQARAFACYLAGGDPTNISLVHPIRLPGSWHLKAEPRLCQSIAITDNEIDLADALERLGEAARAMGSGQSSLTARASAEPEAEPGDIVAALREIQNADLPWDEWNRIGMAIYRALGPTGEAAFHGWSRKSGKYDATETQARWDHYGKSPPSKIGAGTLFHMARQARPGWCKPSSLRPDPPPPSEADYYDVPAGNAESTAKAYANGYTNGHDPDHDPDPFDAPAPAEPNIDAELTGLARNSTPDEINRLLRLIANRRLDPVTIRSLCGRIKAITGTPTSILEDGIKAFTRVEQRNSGPNHAWLKQARLTEEGAPKACLSNTTLYLRSMGCWPEAFAWNEFSLCVELRIEPPWSQRYRKPCSKPWRDIDNLRLAEEIQLAGMDIGDETVFKAVQVVADDRRHHPVREWLSSLKWDGVPRIDKWLNTYCSVPLDNPMLGLGAKWLIGCVRRVFEAGCKFDSMLVLIGPGDIGKSLAFRILAGDEWFSDDMGDVGHKDASVKLAGKWIIEAAELASIRKAESNQFFAFVSRQVDNYRPPYGRTASDFPRQCAFAGTANDTEWLTGHEAERRFWLFDVTSIDADALARDRSQIWAEAYHRFAEDDHTWIEDAAVRQAATDIRDQHTATGDVWRDKISDYLRQNILPSRVTAAWVLTNALGIEITKCGKPEQTRVGQIMRSLGWRSVEKRGSDPRRWYVPVRPEEAKWRFENGKPDFPHLLYNIGE